ncbi:MULTISPECIES: glutathione S-transferase family protein [Pseudomonas]|uniref:Glutathione S-transferase-like protein n=1 Tax=Pseudomonas chlororaphis subsp. aureofaciens TaxID=587851 RepID=A0AAD0ZGM9_9PSED|nr:MULTISPECIES: glutathione S-transferase [Pseudomonas]AZC62291.1 putative glutathione S-transferase-like protein [Pseudomonas chlororaphis subsp. piscium]AZE03946.1 putative glutathione S-transferase-like protein [Pseudomonas chlororaphis subsp. aureofaciens]AZE22252.1 putative glutathione S-transferase-like protein [Pseudomonas chlororaphis subsp. aureofaciens]AZE28604.1 putative glutathione S-transferase-like protein [Pseudomonas chlororaphis subsp. aureofaciens]AZE34849.1 putative glutath
MLKIWGRKNSSNVRKALWCAEELGLTYEAVDAGGAFGVVDTPAYRAMNPNGRIPLIEDDGFVLWESNTIVRYLVARHAAGTAWYPDDVRARASAEKWMDWTTSTFAEPFRHLFWGVLRTPAQQQDWDKINAALHNCGELLAVVDQALAEHPYLSGDEIGMGDIPLGSFIYAWFEMPIERPPLSNLQAWYARLQQRPAYRKAVMTALT